MRVRCENANESVAQQVRVSKRSVALCGPSLADGVTVGNSMITLTTRHSNMASILKLGAANGAAKLNSESRGVVVPLCCGVIGLRAESAWRSRGCH